MDLRQLEIFATACEKGSLSSAAACLNTSQPNVSKNIRALEEELGRPLLVRSGKGVQPTAYGRAVLEYAVIMRKAAEKIASLAVPEGENSLRLSAYPSRMIPRMLVDFYQAWGEDVHIEYRQGSVEEIIDHVHQGISELGVVFVAQKRLEVFENIISYRRLRFLPRGAKRLCLYVGPKHPLYGAEQVDVAQLSGMKFLRGVRDFFSVEHHLETVSVGAVDAQELSHWVYTSSDHLAASMLQHTDVCCLGVMDVCSPYDSPEIHRVPIQGTESLMQAGYVCDPEVPLSRQARWMMERIDRALDGGEKETSK